MNFVFFFFPATSELAQGKALPSNVDELASHLEMPLVC